MNRKVYQFGNFVLDQHKRELFLFDKSVVLSAKAFEILALLVEKNGGIVDKDEIFERVWKNNFVEENNLPVQISALRKLFRNGGGETDFIKTVSGRGYSFVAPVRENPAAERAEIFAKNDDEAVSIAVLPLAFAQNSEDLAYLSKGITQSLIDNLAQIADLKVLAYSAVREFADASYDIQDIGFLLGANKILTGEIAEYKNRFEITVELINVQDKTHLWGMQQLFENDDIFQIKKEISLKIVEKLELQLSKENRLNLLRKQEINFEAQKLYFQGVMVLESRVGVGNIREVLGRAINYFQQAIKIEPQYAAAYVGIGMAYVSLYNHTLINKEEALRESLQALRMALASDDKLSQAYVLEASILHFIEHDRVRSQSSLETAIELNPNNADAYHWKGMISMALGDFEKAETMEKKAIRLDPVSHRFNSQLMRIYFYAGDYHKTISYAEELLELKPGSADCLLFLAYANAELDLFEKSSEAINRAVETRTNPEFLLIKGIIFAKFGQTSEAEKTIVEVSEKYPSEILDYCLVGEIYALLNETDKAIEMLEKAYQAGSVSLLTIKVTPHLRNLHSDARFNRLLEKINLI